MMLTNSKGDNHKKMSQMKQVAKTTTRNHSTKQEGCKYKYAKTEPKDDKGFIFRHR